MPDALPVSAPAPSAPAPTAAPTPAPATPAADVPRGTSPAPEAKGDIEAVPVGDPKGIFEALLHNNEVKKKAEAEKTPIVGEKAPEAKPGEAPAVPEVSAAGQTVAGAEADEDEQAPVVADAKPASKMSVEELRNKHLTDIKDERVRKNVNRRLIEHKAFRDQFPVEEAQQRKMLHPTVSAAQEDQRAAARAFQLQGAYIAGTPEGAETFAAALHSESPQAYTAFAEEVVKTLPNTHPQLFETMRQNAVADAMQHLRGLAQQGLRIGDIDDSNDFAVAAEILAVAYGLPTNGAAQSFAPQEPAFDDNDPRAQRLAELERRVAETDVRDTRTFQGRILQALDKAFEPEITSAIKAVDPDNLFPDKARQKLVKDIVADTRFHLRQNPTVNRQTLALLENGQRDQAHVQRVLSHLINSGRPALMEKIRAHLSEYVSTFRAVNNGRSDRQTQLESRKELGAAGAPASIAPRALPEWKGSQNAADWFKQAASSKR